jgi:hypothetical protein
MATEIDQRLEELYNAASLLYAATDKANHIANRVERELNDMNLGIEARRGPFDWDE